MINFIVSGILFALIVAAVLIISHDKKEQKKNGTYGCSGCPYSGKCGAHCRRNKA